MKSARSKVQKIFSTKKIEKTFLNLNSEMLVTKKKFTEHQLDWSRKVYPPGT